MAPGPAREGAKTAPLGGGRAGEGRRQRAQRAGRGLPATQGEASGARPQSWVRAHFATLQDDGVPTPP